MKDNRGVFFVTGFILAALVSGGLVYGVVSQDYYAHMATVKREFGGGELRGWLDGHPEYMRQLSASLDNVRAERKELEQELEELKNERKGR